MKAMSLPIDLSVPSSVDATLSEVNEKSVINQSLRGYCQDHVSLNIKLGVVAEVKGAGLFSIIFDDSRVEYEAVAAASCLIAIDVGDVVSCIQAGQQVWIHSVLTKVTGFVAPPFSLSKERLEIHSDSVHVRAKAAISIDADRILQNSRVLKESVDQKFSDVNGNRVEYSKNLIVRVSQHINVKADSIVQSAAGLVKIDGSQIHMG